MSSITKAAPYLSVLEERYPVGAGRVGGTEGGAYAVGCGGSGYLYAYTSSPCYCCGCCCYCC